MSQSLCQHKASVNTGIFPAIYFDPNINFVLEKAQLHVYFKKKST